MVRTGIHIVKYIGISLLYLLYMLYKRISRRENEKENQYDSVKNFMDKNHNLLPNKIVKRLSIS